MNSLGKLATITQVNDHIAGWNISHFQWEIDLQSGSILQPAMLDYRSVQKIIKLN